MNKKLFLPPLFVLMWLVSSVIPASSANILNFDDLSHSSMSNGLPFYEVAITNDYQGFSWDNFYALNAPFVANTSGTNGYYYGMLTASNIAFNGGGTPAEVDSLGSSFNFLSAYLTGAWNSNLNIEVQGFSGTNLLYDETVLAGATNSTLFSFNYLNIDRLTFNSFGGQPAFGVNAEQFVMDNFTFEFVPEPSSLLLAGFAALMLRLFLKRKRG